MRKENALEHYFGCVLICAVFNSITIELQVKHVLDKIEDATDRELAWTAKERRFVVATLTHLLDGLMLWIVLSFMLDVI